MYADHAPVPNAPCDQVLVIEASDTDIEAIIEEARDYGATTEDGDGDEIFWIVFAEEPRRLWDFTERSLRSSLKSRAA